MRAKLAGTILLCAVVSLGMAASSHFDMGPVHRFTPEPYANAPMITFANGFTIDTRDGEPSLPERFRMTEPVAGKATRIIHFNGPMQHEWIERLNRLDIRAFGYLPNYAVMAALDAAQCEIVRALPMVTWVGLFQPAYKLQDVLLNAAGRRKLVIQITPNEDYVPVTEFILKQGGQIDDIMKTEIGSTVTATFDAMLIPKLAQLQEVIWMQVWSEPTLCNNSGQWVVQTGWRATAPSNTDTIARRVWKRGVRGQRIVLGTTDTGINVYGPGHDLFRDLAMPVTPPGIWPGHRKVVCYKLYSGASADENPYHGSHVNGTVAGDDSATTNSNYYDGMSIKARIYFVDVSNSSGSLTPGTNLWACWDSVYPGRGLPDSIRPIKQQSSSWGWTNGAGTYLLQDASTDAYCWLHKDFLNLIAAGNSGSTRTIINPGIAKDVITVGALQNGTLSNAIASFSSRGPTQDNRIKPTLCDPGDVIYSATASPGTSTYSSMSGTSMATPMMNGSVGLIRCYLKEGFYPSGAKTTSDTFGYISAALLRSMAIASADPNIGSYTIPSFDVGWGRIDVDSVLYFTGDTRKLIVKDDTVGVSTGQYREQTFQVNSSIPLRIALAWTDTAGAINANPAIVNNLDLLVTAPSGAYYRGNKYSAGQSQANPTGWDSVNVEECARVNSPATGVWTIRVNGTNVASARQPLAWTITGDVSAVSASVDVQTVSIVAPTGTVNQGSSLTPQATVRNNGTAAATFNVKFDISDGYTSTQPVTALGPGATQTVTFGSWTANTAGNLTTKCSTQLSGDLVPTNDKVTGAVMVQTLDAQTLSIDAPTGTVNQGTLVAPRATVKNNGNTAQTFTAKFTIAGGYADSQSVTLAAGAQQQATFANWTAGPAGTQTTKCSTRLAGDMTPSNNARSDSVLVQTLDALTLSIDAPTGAVTQGALVAPRATVKNNGNTAQTFTAKFTITPAYADSQGVTLAAGAQQQVTFANWTAGPVGTQTTKCTTRLAGDMTPSNDRLTGSVSVVSGPDVQTVAILAPTGTVNQGQAIVPQASVRNNSTSQAIFPVRFDIGAGYTNTQTCTLAASQTQTVNFLSWTANPLGSLAVKCTTMLTGDVSPGNDQQTGAVFVQVLDVQTVSIIAPTGTVSQGQIITPQASLRNNGNATVIFPAEFDIGSAYTNIQTCTLTAGQTKTASFTSWTANPVGNLATKCSTQLAGDVTPGNDKVTGTVLVQGLDVQTVSILAPTGTVDQGQVITPQSSVRNNGNTTSIFPVRFDIGAAYNNTQTCTLTAGQTRTASFTSWTANPIGNLATKCSTQLAGDMTPDNDKATGTVFVRVLDAEAVSISAPTGIVDSGATVTPQATVRNNGNTTVDFDVRFDIGAGYSNTQTVTGLAPGSSATIGFADWTARERGTLTTRCTTLLSGDMANANDLVTGSVDVAVYDVGVVAILAPSGSIPPGPVIPQARVHNYGTSREAVDVFFLIDATPPYIGTANLMGGLPVGTDTMLVFPSWNATPGSYVVTCSTYLASDQVRANDVVTCLLGVGAVDVGVLRITAPVGPLDSSLALAPAAKVKNYGDVAAAFKAFFTIDNGSDVVVYGESVAVPGLAPGDSAAASFAAWAKPHAVGPYTTRCSTYLAVDCLPVNNVVAGSFTITAVPAQSGWVQKADVPTGPKNKKVKDGACLAYSSDSSYSSNSIYAFKGNNRFEFYQYNIETNTWATQDSIPAIGSSGKKKGVKKGATLTHAESGFYATKGNNTLDFWLYNPSYSSYPWTQVTDVPTGAKDLREGAGSAAVTLDGTTYVYLLKGSGTQEFYRYNTSTNTWEAREPAPLGTSGKTWKNGSCIAFDGDKTIYALKGSYNEFFAYDVDSNTWTTKPGLPFIGNGGKKKKVKDGAGIAYSKTGTLPFSPRKPVVSLFSPFSPRKPVVSLFSGNVYALKGGNTYEFWTWAMDSDRWTQKEDMPIGGGKRVKGGGAIVYAAIPNALYATKGNNTLEFYKYGLSVGNSQPTAYSPNEMSNSQLSTFNLKLAVTPNPFTGTTTISYTLPKAGNVSLTLYDVTGKLVTTLASGCHTAGTSSFIVHRSSLASGIYLLKLETDNTTATAKLIIE